MTLQMVNHASGDTTDVDSVDHAKTLAGEGKKGGLRHWRVFEKDTGKTVHLVEDGKTIVGKKPPPPPAPKKQTEAEADADAET